jgi:LytS/YehU family sensor histidine kinase
MLQPYIENAVRHGLIYKQKGIGIIKVNCTRLNRHLIMEVEDNGIGRSAAALNSPSVYKTNSSKVTEERLANSKCYLQGRCAY